MIRTVTCLAVALACGSGLYLYQSKHRVKVVDDQIAQTVKATEALRAQTRMLSAEWTLLNDPERLRQLANQYLTLQTVSPSQFTSLADLNGRLPPPVQPGPPPDTGGATPVPVASDGSGGPGPTGEDAGKPADAKLAEASSAAVSPKDATPKDAVPAGPVASPITRRIAATAPAEAPRPTDRRVLVPRPTPSPPRLVADAQRPLVQRGPAQRETGVRSTDRRLAEARPFIPVPRVLASRPMGQAGGSLLGMAHDMASPPMPMPLPRPLPMNADQQYSGAGG